MPRSARRAAASHQAVLCQRRANFDPLAHAAPASVFTCSRHPQTDAHTTRGCGRYLQYVDIQAAAGIGIWAAAGWGLAGGVSAGLVTLSPAILKAGYRWPWTDNPDGWWPRLVVTATGIAVGALVAAAAHAEMSGAWPAFLLGVGAPSVIRGAIARIEVEELEQTEPQAVTVTPAPPEPHRPKRSAVAGGKKRKKLATGRGGP